MTDPASPNWRSLLDPAANELSDALFARAKALEAEGTAICPPSKDIFRALRLTPPASVKAIIIGQDPYFGPDQAEGLAFSVAPDVPIPPSLRNIFDEYESDLGLPRPASGSLVPWAKAGVLLLNTYLTTERGSSEAHADWGWERLTGAILQVAARLPQPKVFIAWGAKAKAALYSVSFTKTQGPNGIVKASHPSPYSAHRGFLGSRPFTTTNNLLISMGADPVDWRLP